MPRLAGRGENRLSVTTKDNAMPHVVYEGRNSRKLSQGLFFAREMLRLLPYVATNRSVDDC